MKVEKQLSDRVTGRSGGPGRAGFTLIELLVVVSLIVLLVGILLPSLGAAQRQARLTHTKTTMSGLASACDMYYSTFNAYPGPIPTSTIPPSTAGTLAVGNASKISGSQNMFLGLSYAMVPAAKAPSGSLSIPGSGGSLAVDATRVTGPVNFASVKPDGSGEQLPAFFNPTPLQISAGDPGSPLTWYAGGVSGIDSTTGNKFGFPVVLDAFPDALPILYYRRIPGTTGAAGAFSLFENQEYTSAKALGTLNHLTSDQTKAPLSQLGLDSLVGTDSTAAYLIVAAGSNRFYGTYNGKVDGIGQAGGH